MITDPVFVISDDVYVFPNTVEAGKYIEPIDAENCVAFDSKGSLLEVRVVTQKCTNMWRRLVWASPSLVTVVEVIESPATELQPDRLAGELRSHLNKIDVQRWNIDPAHVPEADLSQLVEIMKMTTKRPADHR